MIQFFKLIETKGIIQMPDRLVYSTDGGRINTCPQCGQPYQKCRCNQPTAGKQPVKKNDGIVRIMRDKKHRGGKTVTVITGIPASAAADITLVAAGKAFNASAGVSDASASVSVALPPPA